MTTIDIQALTPEQKKVLRDQLEAERKEELEKRTQDLKALGDLEAETVPNAFKELKAVSENIRKAKEEIFRAFEDYLKLKIEIHGTKAQSQKSHTITHGKQSIKLGYRITDGYSDDAGYGLELVHKFLGTLAKDDNSKKLLSAINRLLQKNSKGDLDSKKVLELKQIADKYFPDTDLQKGVEIIQNSYKPKLSKWFIEAWEVDGVGIERSVPLSMTSIDLPKDIDLSFLLNND